MLQTQNQINPKRFCSISAINLIPIKLNIDLGKINFNIVTLKESGVITLENLIKKGFSFKLEELVAFLKDMIQLGYQSELLNIANRNINPNNILLSENFKEWKLSDYSFAYSSKNSPKEVLNNHFYHNFFN